MLENGKAINQQHVKEALVTSANGITALLLYVKEAIQR